MRASWIQNQILNDRPHPHRKPTDYISHSASHLLTTESLRLSINSSSTDLASNTGNRRCVHRTLEGNLHQQLDSPPSRHLHRRNIVYKEKELIIPLYKTIVRPHLEYCIQAWRPYRKKDIDMLERVQRRATKMIQKLRNISYEMRLKECGLTTLETEDWEEIRLRCLKYWMGMKILTEIFFSQSRKTEGLEDMDLH